MMKKAFTLLEMLVVVAVIGVLLGLVATAATGAIRQAREQRASALGVMLKEAVESYHAQKDEWPYFKSGDGGTLSRTNDIVRLTDDQTDKLFYEVVRETLQESNPLIDVSALFVAESGGGGNGVKYGSDFMDAVRPKRKRDGKRIPVSKMAFGYPNPSDGSFKRFHVEYNFLTDSIEVKR